MLTSTGLQVTTRVFSLRIHGKSLTPSKRFPCDIELSSVLETKTSGTGRLTYKPNGYLDRTGEKIMLNVAESGHPVFRRTSPSASGSFQSKRAGKVSIHFNAEPQRAVLFFFRTQCLPPISSVFTEQVHFWSNNQCEQATNFGAASGSDMFPPYRISCLTNDRTWDPWARGGSARRRDEEIAYLLNAAKLAPVCEDAGFVRTVSVGQFFMTRSELGLSMFGDSRVCRDNTHLRDHPDAHPTRSIDVNGKFGP